MAGAKPSVLIVGAGIGGLSAAIGLSRSGVEVRILEAAPKLEELGAGIQFGPNATRVLDELGVLAHVLPLAVRPRELVYRDGLTGEPITRADLGQAFLDRYGYPYIVVHRADVYRQLLGECEAHGVTIETDRRVVGVDDLQTRARARCEDGSVHEADVLVGADGLHSRVRDVISLAPPRRHPYMAYRGTVPTASIAAHSEADAMVMWVAPGLHMVQYKVAAGELYNQVGVFRSPSFDSEGWGGPDELDAAFANCCEPLREASRLLSRERCWPMIDRDPIPTWTRNRITLLGDAAHPTQPFLAQGGCQALEDASVLAKVIAAHPDLAEALREYERQRVPRTARVVLNGRRMGEASHIDGIGVELRNAAFGRHEPYDFTPFDWLYGTEDLRAAELPSWLEPAEMRTVPTSLSHETV